MRQERREPVMRVESKGELPVLTFPKLDELGMISHCFTTRLGGVSSGQFTSLNFSIKLGDSAENVAENFRRVAAALGTKPERMTGTVQTHTVNIRRVTEADAGKGIVIETDYEDVDGLVTDCEDLTLAVYTADCVPIFFVDPVRRAIGLAHSGWRGTVNNMAGRMVERMQKEFSSRPSDLVVGIGPSICRDCYEVDETVADCFRKALGDTGVELDMLRTKEAYPFTRTGKSGGEAAVLINGREPGKYQLDLWLANMIFLCRAGVLPSKIDVTDLCTAHNQTLLFSHRASKGKRGNLGSFLRLVHGGGSVESDFGL